MSRTETELHVFHYPTYSLLWQITTTPGSGCFTSFPHLHTPSGDDAFITCHPYLTRDSAEASIAGTLDDHIDNGDALGTVHAFWHRDDAVRLAAGEITATR